jgi:sialate O-acetylesterase
MLLWNKIIYRSNMSRFLLVFLLLFISFTSFSTVILPDVFSDNMVLQQKSTIKIWGIAKPHKNVIIKASWSQKSYKFRTKKDGRWVISIETPVASFEKQTITFSDGKTTTLSNVLIGEVWFCSGQSNMEMPLKGYKEQPIDQAEETIKNGDVENGIRMLKVKRNAQEVPVTYAEGTWMLSSSKNLESFSAVAYFYALTLRQKLNVPIGIINSSWGGSSIEGWMSKSLVDSYSDYSSNQPFADNETTKKTSVMYNGMIQPFINYVIKGFVWYQGEANVDRYKTYAAKLKDMVSLWRMNWNLGDLPFYIVEIAPFNYQNFDDAPRLREQQFQASQQIKNCGIVNTNDLIRTDEVDNIHPSLKEPVGKRLANLALNQTYGIETICAKSPNYKLYEIQNNQLILHFDNVYDGFKTDSLYIGFEIAGNDQLFYPANAVLYPNNTIAISSEQVVNPIAARYCFHNFSIGNIYNSCGLPLFGFRTYNW